MYCGRAETTVFHHGFRPAPEKDEKSDDRRSGCAGGQSETAARHRPYSGDWGFEWHRTHCSAGLALKWVGREDEVVVQSCGLLWGGAICSFGMNFILYNCDLGIAESCTLGK